MKFRNRLTRLVAVGALVVSSLGFSGVAEARPAGGDPQPTQTEQSSKPTQTPYSKPAPGGGGETQRYGAQW